MSPSLNEETIAHIQREYYRTTHPWFLAYSGGKDSSALLKLVFIALLRLEQRPKPMTVVYCDTGVEIPIARSFAIKTLQAIAVEAETHGLPIYTQIVTPLLRERYFVKVIGRGYPPPTNKFRWCTKRLLTKPLKQVLDLASGNRKILVLGTRREESVERRKTISRHETTNEYYFHQSRNQKALIYSPLVDYSYEGVWITLTQNSVPRSIDANNLLSLYKGEGRLGCWTCTVVRRDRATESLIKDGHTELEPLLEFRNWLLSIRDKSNYRCKRRRNGASGPGPFTLAARQIILEKLLSTQKQSGLDLISQEELQAIKALWEQDKSSAAYSET